MCFRRNKKTKDKRNLRNYNSNNIHLTNLSERERELINSYAQRYELGPNTPEIDRLFGTSLSNRQIKRRNNRRR